MIPFPNGTSAMNWQDYNCLLCKKYENKSTKEEDAKCNPAFHIDMGYILGEIPDVMAHKVGWDGKGYLNDKCNLKQ